MWSRLLPLEYSAGRSAARVYCGMCQPRQISFWPVDNFSDARFDTGAMLSGMSRVFRRASGLNGEIICRGILQERGGAGCVGHGPLIRHVFAFALIFSDHGRRVSDD